MKYRKFVLIYLFMFLSGNLAYAADNINNLTLTDAVKIAFENNHELRGLKNSLSAQKNEIKIAKSNFFPKIMLEERLVYSDNPTFAFSSKLGQERFGQSDFEIQSLNNPDPVTDYQTMLSFEQPLFIRKADIGYDMARKELSIKEEEFIRKKEETVFNIIQLYLAVNTAKAYNKTAEKGVEEASEHLKNTHLRYDSGMGILSDVLRASSMLKEAEQKVISSARSVKIAKRGLGLLLGTSEPVETADDNIEIPVNDIGYYINSASKRKDLNALRLKRENAQNNIRLAEAQNLPAIKMGGNYQLNDRKFPFGADGKSWQIMLSLGLPLYDGSKTKNEKAKAGFQLAEIDEYLKGTEDQIAYMIFDAYSKMEEAAANRELAKIGLQDAEEAMRLTETRYKNSLSPLVDLLDAQSNLERARANVVARGNEYMLSTALLTYEGGTLLKDLNID